MMKRNVRNNVLHRIIMLLRIRYSVRGGMGRKMMKRIRVRRKSRGIEVRRIIG